MTDRRTDGRTLAFLELLSQLKKNIFIFYICRWPDWCYNDQCQSAVILVLVTGYLVGYQQWLSTGKLEQLAYFSNSNSNADFVFITSDNVIPFSQTSDIIVTSFH